MSTYKYFSRLINWSVSSISPMKSFNDPRRFIFNVDWGKYFNLSAIVRSIYAPVMSPITKISETRF